MTAAILFGSAAADAKYATSVFQRPCHEIELEVSNCELKAFSNVEEETRYRKEFQNWKPGDRLASSSAPLTYSGALFEGKILSAKPAKCQNQQNMSLKGYAPLTKKTGKFFALNMNCPKQKKVRLLEIKGFCDTPGAFTVPECFRNHLMSQGHFMIVSEVSGE